MLTWISPKSKRVRETSGNLTTKIESNLPVPTASSIPGAMS